MGNVHSIFNDKNKEAIASLIRQNLIIEELREALDKERFENKKLIEENDRLNRLLNGKATETK